MQPTCGVDDHPQRRLLLQPTTELFEVAVITEIQTRLTASAEGQHRESWALLVQKLADG